jgi:hypothetical protein
MKLHNLQTVPSVANFPFGLIKLIHDLPIELQYIPSPGSRIIAAEKTGIIKFDYSCGLSTKIAYDYSTKPLQQIALPNILILSRNAILDITNVCRNRSHTYISISFLKKNGNPCHFNLCLNSFTPLQGVEFEIVNP